MAATVPVETEGATSPLVEQAMRIGEPPQETTEKDIPAHPEPKDGSFEAFMGSFGNAHRWGPRS